MSLGFGLIPFFLSCEKDGLFPDALMIVQGPAWLMRSLMLLVANQVLCLVDQNKRCSC